MTLKEKIALRIRRRIASPDYGYPAAEAKYNNFEEYCRDPLR